MFVKVDMCNTYSQSKFGSYFTLKQYTTDFNTKVEVKKLGQEKTYQSQDNPNIMHGYLPDWLD